MIKSVTENEFENEVLNNDGRILVDFYATWCGPCMKLSPVLEEISNTRANYNIVKVNVDENPNIARRFGVESIPTLILFNEGKAINKQVGLISKNEVIDMLEE